MGAGGSIPGVGTGVSSGIIPSMQGFFIKALANSTLSVTNSARVHSSQAFYKEGAANDLPILRLKTIDINGLTDEAIIRFYEESTFEHDRDYDAFKLFGWMYPQLYSITPEQSELAINTIPGYSNGTTILLGFQSPADDEYVISLSEFENFEMGTEIYLEDLFTGNIHKISDFSEYSFTSNPEQDPNRFLLHIAMDVADISLSNDPPGIKIYSYENKVYIHLPEKADQALVKVFNLMGQKIQSQNIYGLEAYRLNIQSKSGYYVVTVQLGDQYFTEKVYIK